MLRATPIEFTERGPLPIGVEFFDRGGASGRARAELTMECGAREGVCGGTECILLDFGDNCGGCGLTCPGTHACDGGPTCSANRAPTQESRPASTRVDPRIGASRPNITSGPPAPSPATSGPPTTEQVTFELVSVECSCSSGFNTNPNASETCGGACGRFGSPGCSNTLLRVREAGGAPTLEGDNCGPPHQRPVSGALQAGQTYTLTYNTVRHACRCGATAR